MNEMRVAKVSAVQKESGMVSVIYPEQEQSASDFLPFLCFGEEFHPPSVDDIVLVAGLSNGVYNSVVLGGFWNRKNIPENKGDEWWKRLTGNVEMRVKDEVMVICAKDIILKTGEKEISLAGMAGD